MLDIGCGLTSILNIIDFGKKYGVDIGVHKLSTEGFDLNKDIYWIAGDGEYLPFENDSLDIVFSTNSLDHIPHPKKCLKEIKRVLKHNGLFFLIIDIFSKDRGYRNKKHPNSLTSEEIKKMLSDFKIFKEIAMDEEPVGVSNYINSKQKRKSKSVKKDNKTSLFLICTNSPTK